MNNQDILGMNSAYEHAKQCAYGANMSISAALVVDMVKRIAELGKEREELNNDLLETQEQCREAENKLEDIESFFVDEDACPLIEPLSSNGLEVYFRKLKLNQQAKGVEDFTAIICGDGKDPNLTAISYCATKYIEALKEQGE